MTRRGPMSYFRKIAIATGSFIVMGGLVVALLSLGVGGLFLFQTNMAAQKAALMSEKFPPGYNVDALIETAEELGADEIWWKTDRGEEAFGQSPVGGRGTPVDFLKAAEKFKNLESGEVHFLFQGGFVNGAVFSIRFAERKILETSRRTTD